jgi:acyl-CoA dehydrogenase
MVDLTVPGVLQDEVKTFDPTRGAHRIAIDADATRKSTFELSDARLDRVLLPLRLFIAAQALGVAQRALQIAIEHVSTRRQFGRPLGAFQAIKHQLADVHLMNEKARVLTQFAAQEAVAGVAAANVDCHLAWVCATRAAIGASQTCLQAHGAIGFAWEHPCHLFLKRAHSLAASFVGVVPSRERIQQYVNQPAKRMPSHM